MPMFNVVVNLPKAPGRATQDWVQYVWAGVDEATVSAEVLAYHKGRYGDAAEVSVQIESKPRILTRGRW